MRTKFSEWSDFPAYEQVRTGRIIRGFARFTFVLLIVSILAMLLLPWRQTAIATGTVVALDPQQRPQPVMNAVKGMVSYVKPNLIEGSYVEKDELLLRLTPFALEGVQQIDTQISAIEAKLSAADSSLMLAEQAVTMQVSGGKMLTEALNLEYQAAEQKWEQAKNEESSVRAELEDKRNQLRIAEEVAPKGLISQEELFTKRQAVESQFQKVLKAENAVEEAYRSLLSKEQDIESKKQEIDLKNQSTRTKVLDEFQKRQTIEKELTDLKTKRGEFDRLEIRAPRSGYIQQWLSLTGSDIVKEGDQLFVIVPDADQLAVEMTIKGNDMPLVQPGRLVRLQFQGWPAVQFVGWPSVAIGTFGGRVERVFPTDDGFGGFRILVVPDMTEGLKNDWPEDRYLRQGVRANGWVLLDKVPLGYEVWRQLNGFPPTVTKDGGGKEDKPPKVKLPKA